MLCQSASGTCPALPGTTRPIFRSDTDSFHMRTYLHTKLTVTPDIGVCAQLPAVYAAAAAQSMPVA